ncbi:AAA family ATPase [Ktedonobacter robiniae]|uniref:Nuclease SbcCD subunit C n=1 Tax=Ktedonobacter robiniae TaxID=2778365 RepID=A0ABQ3UKN2_9CHLR|nr:SMC family ATPase [Ktedonobacter robiniae]GHO53223.1 exonuclease SbcC [Ktedonobacter robiniae]
MLITRIELENIKSYRHFSVDFRRGTTAISGENGAGKTTLVEAIGFALFDYLPYSQARFVREGEKWGRVLVHLLGGDERPYVVERRCGSGSRWLIHDEEANMRIEQGADVLDKLHELFGIDRERPLDSLFRDALGVPQGTFTSIFLEAASKRKQTFDALLQIEDYKAAAEYLLDSQKDYREQMQQHQSRIDQLEYETRELEQWREQLKQSRQEDAQQKVRNAELTTTLAQLEKREQELNAQYNQLQDLRRSSEARASQYDSARSILANYQQALAQAQAAEQIAREAEKGYQQYLQAERALEQLREQEQQRNRLLKEQARLGNKHASIEMKAKGLHTRLQEVEQARQRIDMLQPDVLRQQELEERRDELLQNVKLYKSICEEGQNQRERLESTKKTGGVLEQRIAVIEPLVELAQRLPELDQARSRLQVQSVERKNKFQQLNEKRRALHERRDQHAPLLTKLQKAERNVQLIDENRAEAEEMPALQECLNEINARLHRLDGNIEAYSDSLKQSAGGQCPLLREPCLNIKNRGMVSLESYFENLLIEERAQRQQVLTERKNVETRIEQIKKYADALGKYSLYVEKRDDLKRQMQQLESEMEQLEEACAELEAQLEMLKEHDSRMRENEEQYKESKLASEKVATLPGLRDQLQQNEQLITQYETDIQTMRERANQLRDSEPRLQQVNEQLTALNDPRAQLREQRNIVAQAAQFQMEVVEAEQELAELNTQLAALHEQLAAYYELDAHIEGQEKLRQRSQGAHQNYLKHIEQARALPERERVCRQQEQETEQAHQRMREAEQAYMQARATFNEQELDEVRRQRRDLHGEISSLAEKMQQIQRTINEAEQRIQNAEQQLHELEGMRQEYRELEDLHTMMEYFRKVIKEAAPYVLKAMLNDISAEANRIFGEIMGDRSAQLSWQNDYEVVLRRQGVSRTFAQLSGGEQMSAALAVRLALLKKLSTLNLAFFDEPTQNMDELRRMNLAEQIRRVRGFEQLIVISHDDTFEQGLDSLIRLRKASGETQLQHEGLSESSFSDEALYPNGSNEPSMEHV